MKDYEIDAYEERYGNSPDVERISSRRGSSSSGKNYVRSRDRFQREKGKDRFLRLVRREGINILESRLD